MLRKCGFLSKTAGNDHLFLTFSSENSFRAKLNILFLLHRRQCLLSEKYRFMALPMHPEPIPGGRKSRKLKISKKVAENFKCVFLPENERISRKGR